MSLSKEGLPGTGVHCWQIYLGLGWLPNYILSAYLPALAFSNAQLLYWHFGLEEEAPEILCPCQALPSQSGCY